MKVKKVYLKTEHGYTFNIKLYNANTYTYFECKTWQALCTYAFEPDIVITFDIRPEDDIEAYFHSSKHVWRLVDRTVHCPGAELNCEEASHYVSWLDNLDAFKRNYVPEFENLSTQNVRPIVIVLNYGHIYLGKMGLPMTVVPQWIETKARMSMVICFCGVMNAYNIMTMLNSMISLLLGLSLVMDNQTQAAFTSLVQWNVGDGRRILFWKDKWLNGSTVAELTLMVCARLWNHKNEIVFGPRTSIAATVQQFTLQTFDVLRTWSSMLEVVNKSPPAFSYFRSAALAARSPSNLLKKSLIDPAPAQPMKLGWKIVLGSFIGFFGAAFGSIGGVGGGGIFVPMLTLIIGFDPKSSAAMSKCMIMGAAVSTVYCNLKLKHPTLDMPVIDYDLALLIQPMLMLGVSIGVICNVIFPDWLVTVLLIILFIGDRKTIRANKTHKTRAGLILQVSIWKNVYWKEVGLLAFVWVAFLALQVTKNYMATCSIWYWVLNLLQIPVSAGVAMYEAVGLVQGRRVISSKRNEQNSLRAHQLLVYCFLGVTAGVVAGLLGVGGGSIMGPLFLELGVPPQVIISLFAHVKNFMFPSWFLLSIYHMFSKCLHSVERPQVASATATFAMMFSSSMSVMEYYLLNRFPVPYAVYLTILAFFSAIVGQRVVRKLIDLLGRASIIVFILSFMIFISALSLGGVGISNTIHKIARHEYMGFENICKYEA
ncbi:hypothetical protein TRIUR3_09961 [Triticum urartu]|uniref:Sulfite exporter TauE/SafE family protein 3 n=1 Tax=Triticum urartu TaxID=4572 RepID=M7ZYH6_TRIUA|nr:hypothetical protein TRIUR3_09961 [Triticum urartu]